MVDECRQAGRGFSITSAPLYYNGKVLRRWFRRRVRRPRAPHRPQRGNRQRRMEILDHPIAEGKLAATPGPITAPTRPAAPRSGTRRTVNPKTGMLFFSTSNAAPWIGRERKGRKPVHAASIVSLDAEPANTTATTRWSTTTSGLRRAEPDRSDERRNERRNGRSGGRAGEDRLGLRGSTRKTAKPVYPIPEVKVPQDPAENTSATPAGADDASVQPDRSDPGSGRKDRRRRRLLPSQTESSSGANLHPDELDPSSINLVANRGGRWRQTGRRPPSTPKKTMYFVCSQSGALGLVTPHPRIKRRNTKKAKRSSAPTRSWPAASTRPAT